MGMCIYLCVFMFMRIFAHCMPSHAHYVSLRILMSMCMHAYIDFFSNKKLFMYIHINLNVNVTLHISINIDIKNDGNTNLVTSLNTHSGIDFDVMLMRILLS